MDQHAEVISIAEARDARARDGADGAASARPRCAAVTGAGRPCRNYATDGQLCRVHAVQGAAPGSARGTGTPGDTGTPSDLGTPSDAATPGEPPPRDVVGDPASADSRGATAEGASRTDAGGAAARSLGEAAQRAYERLVAEASRRGWNPPVDGLAALDGLHDGLQGEALADRLGELAAFLRRRLTGDYEIDEFGFDEDLTTNLLMPLVRPMHRHYWRVASHGVEHIPATGGGLVVANHAGTLPADAIITRLDIYDRTGRHARELGADLVFRTPFVGEWARKTGVTLASGDDADRLLARGELVAVWPEGFKGVGKLWRDRYKLQRFGRGGFVATALRAQVPIVPTAIVGSEEIWPMVYDLRLLARALGLPYFPVVAQMFALPVLGPFALLPLPSKWVIEYGEPIDTAPYGPEAADDPMIVFDLADRVRDTIQGMLHRNLMGRRSVFL
jgi:1-acyl-sn-glycerol-3-phosphate acyltransferase